ncbi:MAG: hypothetical protein U0350_51855 [Caldilineaceae bacterium]
MSHITMFDTVAPGRIIKESQFDETPYRCPSCTDELWDVQCLSTPDQLWRVSSATGGAYLVAGVTPACPWCGADLAVASESHTAPFTHGLLPPMNGSHQPGQAVNELQWN